MSSRSWPVTLAAGVLAGGAATLVKTQAERVLQPLGERLFPPAPVDKRELGADPAGHPENMPPSELADRALHAVTGDELSDDARVRASQGLHWGMGVGAGLVYAALGRRFPVVRAGGGLAFGAALFGATHASTLPLLGAQASPAALPRAWWVWEGGSHLAYGLALGLGVRGVEALADRLD